MRKTRRCESDMGREREREEPCQTRNPNRMPLTLHAGTACPGEGVQPREEGARLAQHARTSAGDIIELTGAHSQCLHTVEHGTPPSLSRNLLEPSVPPASCPDSTAHVTCRGSDNNKLQQQLAGPASLPCLFTYLLARHSLCAVPSCRCRSFSPLFPSLLSWNAALVPAWLSLS